MWLTFRNFMNDAEEESTCIHMCTGWLCAMDNGQSAKRIPNLII